MKNTFCFLVDLIDESAVGSLFIRPLLAELGYGSADIAIKAAVRKFQVGKGHNSILYQPAFVLHVNGLPAVVIDTKGTDQHFETPKGFSRSALEGRAGDEPLDTWDQQCSSYCLQVNKLFKFRPVLYFLLSNGEKTALYEAGRKVPILSLEFSEFSRAHPKLRDLKKLVGKQVIALACHAFGDGP